MMGVILIGSRMRSGGSRSDRSGYSELGGLRRGGERGWGSGDVEFDADFVADEEDVVVFGGLGFAGGVGCSDGGGVVAFGEVGKGDGPGDPDVGEWPGLAGLGGCVHGVLECGGEGE